MRRFTRLPPPDVLMDAAPDATRSFVSRRAKNAAASFDWPERNGVSIYGSILEVAARQTDQHCSYCDGYRLSATGRPELDHFEPKERAPQLAFEWTNLYLCCVACNGMKLAQWDVLLLKPDANDFSYERYFCCNGMNGSLFANPAAPPEDQLRAKRTIEIFGLNRSDLCLLRRAQLVPRRKYANADLPYRFLFIERD